MRRYVRTPGILIEPIGHLWAAFSPASGETALINDESAAILEVLECGACETAAVCSALALESQVDAEALQALVEASWPRLIEAGLVRPSDVGAASTL
jgi:PqqD family protein of HPr-rel-A system